MSGGSKNKSDSILGTITVGVALCSLLLNVVQYLAGQREAQRQRDAVAKEKAAQQELDAWKAMPTVSFQHWEFRGDTRRVCDYFSPDMVVRPEALGWRMGASKVRRGSIKVLQTSTSERVLQKLHQVCSSKSAADNDAKDWRFVLAINGGDQDVEVTSVEYATGASDSALIDLSPSDGLLIPVGFGLAGRPASISDYVWPSRLTYAWSASLGRQMSQTIAIRRGDVGAIGYVMDAAGKSPILSAPP
jgi:hypothetical protein